MYERAFAGCDYVVFLFVHNTKDNNHFLRSNLTVQVRVHSYKKVVYVSR